MAKPPLPIAPWWTDQVKFKSGHWASDAPGIGALSILVCHAHLRLMDAYHVLKAVVACAIANGAYKGPKEQVLEAMRARSYGLDQDAACRPGKSPGIFAPAMGSGPNRHL